MAKKTSTLDELKVQSTVTALNSEEMNQVKGGLYVVQGRRYVYRTRWTAVDIRANSDAQVHRAN